MPAVTPCAGRSWKRLSGLGFAAKQAEEATDKVLAGEPDATTQSALRSALSLLGRK